MSRKLYTEFATDKSEIDFPKAFNKGKLKCIYLEKSVCFSFLFF